MNSRVQLFIMAVTLLLLSTLNNTLTAQRTKLKWGKCSVEEINLKAVPFDSSATAVVLKDIGKLQMVDYTTTNLTRHRRIKILKQTGENKANIIIPFYSHKNVERIQNLKAQTINLDESGKKEIVKIPKD